MFKETQKMQFCKIKLSFYPLTPKKKVAHGDGVKT